MPILGRGWKTLSIVNDIVFYLMFYNLWVWIKSLIEAKQNPAPPILVPLATALPRPEKIMEPRWITIARGELGIRELPGIASNARILEYNSTTTLGSKDDSECPWCSAFISWCMVQAGFSSTHSAGARSWLNYGQRLDLPKYGCIVVFWRGTIIAPTGHVGFYVGETVNDILVLGGNQDNKVCIAPYPKARLLGYRWPIK